MDDTFPKKPRQVPVFPLPLRPGDPGYTDNHKNLCNRLYDNWYLQNTTSFLGSRWPTPISTPGEPIYSLEDGYRDRLSYEYFKKPVVPPLTSESDNNHQLSTGNLNELGTKEAWNNGDSRINVYRHSPVHCGILAFNTVPGLVRCDSDLENSECDARHTIKSQNNQYFERFHKLDGGLASCRSPSSLELGLYETSYGHSQAPCDICAQLSPKYISGENYKDDKSDHYFARDLSIVHFYQRDSSASTASCVRTCKSPHANSPTLSQILAPSTKYNNESPSINTPPGGKSLFSSKRSSPFFKKTCFFVNWMIIKISANPSLKEVE